MLVYNPLSDSDYSVSRYIDDDRNGSGEPRMTRKAALRIAHYVNDAVDADKRAAAVADDMTTFMVWLAENVRQHAIDNSLCANYERFLSGTLGARITEGTDSDAVRDAARVFVSNATRARKITQTALVPVTVSGVSIGSLNVGYVAPQMLRDGQTERNGVTATVSIYGREDESTPVVTELLSYEDAQQANENYARRGDYALSPRRDNSEDSDGRPSDPFDGQTWLNPATGENEVWCDGCNAWHD